MVVAERLSKTINELREQITPEELELWLLFYEIRSEEEKKQLEDSKRRRR